MSFEEVESIWHSQQPIDRSVDREALVSWITTKSRTFERVVGVTEIIMTFTLLFVAAMFMKDPLLQGHDRILIVAGVASILAAMYVWTGRIARKKREPAYEDSLLGMVNRSIDGIDYQIRRLRGFIWWFAVPNSLGLLIGLFIIDDAKRYLLYGIFIPAFAICIGLTYWQIRREIRLKLLPERQRLDELRNELVQNGD